ncbi:MAG: hypothetical protein ACXAC0_07280 [Candidatus Thorarchaeota archaeon]
MVRGGIDGTESESQRRVRFKASSIVVAVWVVATGYLIFQIGMLPSHVTVVLVVLLGLALFDLFRQHSNLRRSG